MKLMAALARGRFASVLDFLHANTDAFGLRYQDMCRCVGCEFLPDRYRAAVMELLQVLYVDREPCEFRGAFGYIRCQTNGDSFQHPGIPWSKGNTWEQVKCKSSMVMPHQLDTSIE